MWTSEGFPGPSPTATLPGSLAAAHGSLLNKRWSCLIGTDSRLGGQRTSAGWAFLASCGGAARRAAPWVACDDRRLAGKRLGLWSRRSVDGCHPVRELECCGGRLPSSSSPAKMNLLPVCKLHDLFYACMVQTQILCFRSVSYIIICFLPFRIVFEAFLFTGPIGISLRFSCMSTTVSSRFSEDRRGICFAKLPGSRSVSCCIHRDMCELLFSFPLYIYN